MAGTYEDRFKQLVNEIYELKGKPEGRELQTLLREHFETLAISTFYHWIAGSHASYDIRKLKILASMRGWSIAQTVAFLDDASEGGSNSLGKFDPARLYTATIPQVLQALQMCSNILNKDFSDALGKSSPDPNHTSVTMCDLDTLRRLMQAEQVKRQKNNAQFAETLGVSVEFLESFYAGLPVLFDDLTIDAVAQGLPDPEGVYGNWQYIYSLLGQSLDDSIQAAHCEPCDRPSLNGNTI